MCEVKGGLPPSHWCPLSLWFPGDLGKPCSSHLLFLPGVTCAAKHVESCLLSFPDRSGPGNIPDCETSPPWGAGLAGHQEFRSTESPQGERQTHSGLCAWRGRRGPSRRAGWWRTAEQHGAAPGRLVGGGRPVRKVMRSQSQAGVLGREGASMALPSHSAGARTPVFPQSTGSASPLSTRSASQKHPETTCC